MAKKEMVEAENGVQCWEEQVKELIIIHQSRAFQSQLNKFNYF